MAEFPIIEKLGGRKVVFAHLKQKGIVTTLDALRMWTASDRAAIPSGPMVELMEMAEKRFLRYEAADFRLPVAKRQRGNGRRAA